MNKNGVQERKNFYLSKSFLGKGYIVKVVAQNFQYNHDEVFQANKKRFKKGGTAFKSWSHYGYYTKTSGHPNWASYYISSIDSSINGAMMRLNNLTKADVKTVSDAKKQISWLRKMVASHFLSKESSEALAKNPEIQPIFKKYLKTGSISNSEVKQVFLFIQRMFIVPTTVLGIVGLWAVIGITALYYSPLVFFVMLFIFSNYRTQRYFLPLDSKQAKEWNLETSRDYTLWWNKKIHKIKRKTGSWKF